MVQAGQQPGPYGDQVDLAVLNKIKQQDTATRKDRLPGIPALDPLPPAK